MVRLLFQFFICIFWKIWAYFTSINIFFILFITVSPLFTVFFEIVQCDPRDKVDSSSKGDNKDSVKPSGLR